MNWRNPISKSAPTLGTRESDVDLSCTYRDILSEGAPSTTTSWVPAVVPQSFRLLRGLILFGISASGSAVAALGLGLLGYLLLTRALTPSQHLHARTLYLDYSQKDLVAQTAFLPHEDFGEGFVPSNLPPNSRFLPAGQRVDVWVELVLPLSSTNCRGGMAQVVAELVTMDGRTAAKTSRPLLLRSGGWGLWSFYTAPLRWVGLMPDARTMRFPLFQNYKEQDKTPFMVFQVAVKTRDPSWAPEVLGAQVKVQLRMGLIQRMLYALRPGTLLMLLLGLAALGSVVGGSATAAIFLGLWLYTVWGRRGGEGEQAAGPSSSAADDVSSMASGAEGDETSSISGFSEVESVGRQRSSEGLAADAPAPSGRLGDEGDDWQEVVPETSAAGAGRGWGQAQAPGAAAKGPAAGAAHSTDDTAFPASGPASLAGVWEEGPGLVRRRSSAKGGMAPQRW